MDLFEQNLAAVRKIDPELAKRLQSGEEDESVVAMSTEEGSPTIGVMREGKTCLLHHPNSPLADTQSMIASIKDVPAAWNFVILGVGLGYVPLVLMKSRPRMPELMVLVEPSLSVFRTACKTLDLRPILESPCCRLLVKKGGMAMYETMLSNLPRILANHVTVIRYPPTGHLYPEWIQEQESRIRDAWNFGNSSLLTKNRVGQEFVTNLFRNLPIFAKSRGIRAGRGALQNVPAVVVAGGPSLNKNIDRLAELRKHALIIAVDTVLDRMVEIGVPPHVVVAVDPSELNLRHFRRDSYPGVRLAFDPECYPVADRFGDDIVTYTTDKAEFFEWLDKVLGPKGSITKGGMVSQAGFYLARYWGCDPIVLMGQDLALDPESGETHHSQAAIIRKVRWVDGDEKHVDYPAIDADNDYRREDLFWVPGALGGKVPTVYNLMGYLRLVERDIAQSSARVIDATEGGARIEGTDVLSADKVIEIVNGKNFNFESFWERLGREGQSSEKALAAATREIRNRMQRCMENAKTGREILDKRNAGSVDFSACIEKLDPLRRSIFEDPIGDFLIEQMSSKTLFEFLKLGPANADPETYVAQVRRRYTALIDATFEAYEKLRPWLGQEESD